MHPANIEALKVAQIDYASLANNHTLDFGEVGLAETVKTLRSAGIHSAGAGLTSEEAQRPAKLSIQASLRHNDQDHTIDVFSASDHPEDWARVPNFHLIDYSTAAKRHLRRIIDQSNKSSASSLKIFSVHWGPNYSWKPSEEIRDLAHFLIDECGIDIVHGHSPHHVQGIERYKPGKIIIYGCGDFVDDYALTPGYRNDLSAVWRITVNDMKQTPDKHDLVPTKLEVFPTRIKSFQAQLLNKEDNDHSWVCDKIRSLSQDLSSTISASVGEEDRQFNYESELSEQVYSGLRKLYNMTFFFELGHALKKKRKGGSSPFMMPSPWQYYGAEGIMADPFGTGRGGHPFGGGPPFGRGGHGFGQEVHPGKYSRLQISVKEALLNGVVGLKWATDRPLLIQGKVSEVLVVEDWVESLLIVVIMEVIGETITEEITVSPMDLMTGRNSIIQELQ
ncbi:MAG: hypothetical protein Q9165_000003 [Trypethelium subeluteriae]